MTLSAYLTLKDHIALVDVVNRRPDLHDVVQVIRNSPDDPSRLLIKLAASLRGPGMERYRKAVLRIAGC